MIYVISDLHGYPFSEFQRLLEQANFTESDYLFILGDVIDRGEDGIKYLNSCISVLFVPLRAIWCVFGAFRYSYTHCFHVVFVCLWPPLWSKKSSPEKVLSAPAERGSVLRIVA